MLWSNPLLPDARVLIEREVLEGLYSYRQHRSEDDEAGGILLGYRRSPHFHVVEFTTPAPLDRRSRYAFERCDSFHAQHALERWSVSRHRLDCLGEWHTHPEDDPTPSALDRAEWQRVLGGAVHPRVFLIVGLHSEWLGVGDQRRLKAAPVVTHTALGYRETP